MDPLEKICLVARLQGELLRETESGHPDWYAEMLVAAAFQGRIMPTNNNKIDIETAEWGKIQVKERVDGADPGQNRTNFGKYNDGDFDHAAIVIFKDCYELLGAIIIPCKAVLSLVRPAGHVKWQDVEEHAGAVPILDKLLEISGEDA